VNTDFEPGESTKKHIRNELLLSFRFSKLFSKKVYFVEIKKNEKTLLGVQENNCHFFVRRPYNKELWDGKKGICVKLIL